MRGFVSELCTSLCECVKLWYLQMCVRKHLVSVYVSFCVSACVYKGGGSPGAWQYGAVALHAPPVKTPPMGPGQLWPTYTDSQPITSLMTHTDLFYFGQLFLALW